MSTATDLAPRPPQVPATKPATTLFEGFEGAAIAPFDDWARAILAEPVDPRDVEIRPDGIVYLSGVWYRRQLIRAFGAGGWTLVPRSAPQKQGEMVVYHGALVVLGRFVSEAIGECETRSGMSYASALEGARTDCLTRCCKDLGMATELWDRTWRDAWKKDCAHTDGIDHKGKPRWYKNGGSEHDMVPLFVPRPPTPSVRDSNGESALDDIPSQPGGGVSTAPATAPQPPLQHASPPPAGKPKVTKASDIPHEGVELTDGQRKKIFALKAACGGIFTGDDEDPDSYWRSKVLKVYRDEKHERLTSLKQMSKNQAAHLIDRMEAHAAKVKANVEKGVDLAALGGGASEDPKASAGASTAARSTSGTAPAETPRTGLTTAMPDNVINLRDAMNERLKGASEDEFLMDLGFETFEQIPKELHWDVLQALLDPSKRDDVLEKWRVLGWR